MSSSHADAAPTAAASSMQDVDPQAASIPQLQSSPPAGRSRASSGARVAKHPLLPAAIALGAAAPFPLASALSPGSEAKRMRTGDHTPGGSGGLAQWAAESPMSPATTQMAVAMQHARIGAQTPTAGGAGAAKIGLYGPVPPSPSRDPAAALPPTHPHTSPSPTGASAAHSIYSAASTHAAASVATTGISPSRSGPSSAASSPVSAFSLGAGSHSSGSLPVPTSPVSLSPTSVVPHSSAASVTSVAPPVAPAAAITSTPRRTTAAAARHSPAAAHITPPRELEEDDDEDDGPITGSSSKKKDSKQQGASCHQCKTAKDEAHLLFCTTKAGGARRRRCRKKYCDSCLARTYGVDVRTLINGSELSTWSCPSCLGKCTCAGCARKTPHGAGGGRASHVASTSLAIPPALLEAVVPQKKLTKAQQAQLQRNMLHEKQLDPTGTHYLPAAQAAFGTLPAAGGYINSRAISAPLHDSYIKHAYNIAQQQQLQAYESAAAAAVAQASKQELAAASSRPPMLDTTAATPSSSFQDTSPVHMDLIASMLLELTGASSASTTAPATVSAPHSSEMAGASSSAHTADPAPQLPAQPDLTHMSPPKTSMPASLDPARLTALRASGGRPAQPYPNPAPFAFAGSSAGAGGAGARFPSHSPVSLLQSSGSLRSSPPGSHVPLKYATLLSGMTLPGAPARDQRAQSEASIMGPGLAGWKRTYESTQEPETNH